MLKSFSHKELKEYILNHININNVNDSNDINDSNDANGTNDSNDTNNSNDSNKITFYKGCYFFYLVTLK